MQPLPTGYRTASTGHRIVVYSGGVPVGEVTAGKSVV